MNYFTLDGHSTTEWGIGLSGSSVWDAPARKGESISVPGRNGNIWVDDGSFENVMVTYPCWMSKEFDSNIDDFRTFLALHSYDYFELRDTYHPNEYRLARYAGPFIAEPGTRNESGRFDVVFDCYPQRFYNSGGEWVDMTVPSASSESGVSMGTIENETLFTAAPVLCFSTNGAGVSSWCKFTFAEPGGTSNTIRLNGTIYGGRYYYIDTNDNSLRLGTSPNMAEWRSLPKHTSISVILENDPIRLPIGVTEVFDKSTSSQAATLAHFAILPRWSTI